MSLSRRRRTSLYMRGLARAGALAFVLLCLGAWAMRPSSKPGVEVTGTAHGGVPALVEHRDPAIETPRFSVLRGKAYAVDGDSLSFPGGERVRLYGIDSLEKDQLCTRDGVTWACGEHARDTLARVVAQGETECEVQDVDAYQRLVAICWNGATELNTLMVRTGLALAYTRYSTRYANAQSLARELRMGVWARGVQFDAPEVHRHRG